MMSPDERRELAIRIAESMLWMPYRWGGDDPILGYDCSGYIIEILRSVGLLPPAGDWSAHDLWELLRPYRADRPARGRLIWWAGAGGSGRAQHIEICISDDLSIGASGGGRSIISREAAAARNAYIRIRPIAARPGLMILGYADPFAPSGAAR